MIHYSLPNISPDAQADRAKEGFSAVDIELPTEAANAAEISLTGRYPESGFALNKKSEMIVRILEGSATFQCEGEEVRLPEGSTVLVQTDRPYCWIPQDYVKLYVISTPPWTPDQHENVSG